VPIAAPESSTPETVAFDRGVRPVIDLLLPATAKVVVNFRPDPQLVQRIEELAEKNTGGELTEAERAEYAGYVLANKFVAVLQRQARRVLSSGA
jgi:hypothetical protein